ncbi:hypothetical protein AB0B45_51050, partial [Nonomuraea sp. NPDC049152]|uniref:hypothetical protein n=1 Tax=Nonomuraea sp. NPDC049152 TaxID=3154350 RepID=UPI0033FC7DBE
MKGLVVLPSRNRPFVGGFALVPSLALPDAADPLAPLTDDFRATAGAMDLSDLRITTMSFPALRSERT